MTQIDQLLRKLKYCKRKQNKEKNINKRLKTAKIQRFLGAPSANAQIDQNCHNVAKIGHLMHTLVLN